MAWSIVAGADGDAADALWGFQLDAVERSVVFQLCRRLRLCVIRIGTDAKEQAQSIQE
jgi:hypothetical protein